MENAYKHLAKDALLQPLLAKIQLETIIPEKDLYLRLLKAIVFQQLSGKAASTIYQRFLQLFPEEYPHAELLLEMPIETLRTAGLSNQKANYVKNIAQFYIDEKLKDEDLHSKSDEEIIKYLTQIKGVGKWTVEMMLMFAMAREDVLPLDDLVVAKNIQKLYNLEGKGKELKKKMTEVAEKWRPYRSIASRLMWAWKDTVI